MSNKNRIPAILGGSPVFNAPLPITLPTVPPVSVLRRGYAKILQSGMLTNSKYVRHFEEGVAKYLNVKHVIAVSSCTNALMLLMKVLGLRGEVILPSFTFHATAHAVVWNGLTPVFVDCDPDTYNINPQKVEKAITPRTSAILAVHLFGNPADINALEYIAKKKRLKLIFDAAHAFGAKYKGKYIGGFGEAEAFSLSPTKLLTAGEGGLITTNNDEIAEKVRKGRNYGDAGDYDPEFSGLSARMSEFNALLGIESLKMLEDNIIKRNRISVLYRKLLSDIPGISFQSIPKDNRSSCKDFSVLIEKEKLGLNRDELCRALLAENIVAKKYFYPPVHKIKAFFKFKADDAKLINTINLSSRVLSLPLFSHIDLGVVKRVGCAIKNIQAHSASVRQALKKHD